MKWKVYSAIFLAKLYLLHRWGVPSELSIPISGGTTGVMVAMWEDRQRRKRKVF